MIVDGTVSVKLAESSKMDVFYQVIFDKFNFHKDYIIKDKKVYKIINDRGSQYENFIRNCNEDDIHIYEVIKKLNNKITIFNIK